jgi:general secretion pathway protein E
VERDARLLGDVAVEGQPVGESAPLTISRIDSVEAMFEARPLIPREALVRARLVQQESGERLEAVATRLGLISEQALAEEMARVSGIALAGQAELIETPVLPEPLSSAFLHDLHAVPIALSEERVRVAVGNPFEAFVEPAFAFLFDRPVERVIARGSDIDAAIERLCRGESEPEALDEEIDSDDIERLKDLVSDAPVIRAVNRLIAQASDERASDIHIEPTDDSLVVRFRIDGVLREIGRLPATMRAPLVSRIKVMAGLNIAERRLPQDGRLRIAVRGHEIDLRVATAPSIHGESVVMRILDRSKLALDFATLGFEPRLIARLCEAIHRPHGIVLVTGPTGSGKTTTLYAALAELNEVARKLLTIEDPIEYRLPGVVQAQVNPGIGFTFASALRSFLRQDPDVIMVGEIRDVETAQVAVQAALTGHMILSTLHTNTAAGAVTRLLDMEVEPFLLSSVLCGVLAQRLVRRLCTACRQPYAPDLAGLNWLGPKSSAALPAQLYHAVGCPACGNSGYAGRLALLEFLAIDDTVAALILRRSDTRTIAEAPVDWQEHTMLADGLAKAATGLTTIEEVLRVTTGE